MSGERVAEEEVGVIGSGNDYRSSVYFIFLNILLREKWIVWLLSSALNGSELTLMNGTVYNGRILRAKYYRFQ